MIHLYINKFDYFSNLLSETREWPTRDQELENKKT